MSCFPADASQAQTSQVICYSSKLRSHDMGRRRFLLGHGSWVGVGGGVLSRVADTRVIRLRWSTGALTVAITCSGLLFRVDLSSLPCSHCYVSQRVGHRKRLFGVEPCAAIKALSREPAHGYMARLYGPRPFAQGILTHELFTNVQSSSEQYVSSAWVWY